MTFHLKSFKISYKHQNLAVSHGQLLKVHKDNLCLLMALILNSINIVGVQYNVNNTDDNY